MKTAIVLCTTFNGLALANVIASARAAQDNPPPKACQPLETAELCGDQIGQGTCFINIPIDEIDKLGKSECDNLGEKPYCNVRLTWTECRDKYIGHDFPGHRDFCRIDLNTDTIVKTDGKIVDDLVSGDRYLVATNATLATLTEKGYKDLKKDDHHCRDCCQKYPSDAAKTL